MKGDPGVQSIGIGPDISSLPTKSEVGSNLRHYYRLRRLD